MRLLMRLAGSRRNLFLAAYRPFFVARSAVPLEDYPLALNDMLETDQSDAATVNASTRNLQLNARVGHGQDEGRPNFITPKSVLPKSGQRLPAGCF
jgi:hypothetical protein